MSQTTVNYLSVHCQHPFCRPRRLRTNDGRSTFNSHEYCTPAPTTFGLKYISIVDRGDVKKWSGGNIELDNLEFTPNTPYTPYISSIAALTNPGVQNTGVAGVVGEANRPAAHRTAPQRCREGPSASVPGQVPLCVQDALLWLHNGGGAP